MGYNFAALKAQTDILAVIERYETLKKDGPHYRCNCPFHNEDTASMVVTPSKNIWKCFGCGKGGDVFDFLTNYGYTHKEAVAIVTGNTEIGVAYPVKKLEGNTKPPVIWKQSTPRTQPTEINHYRYGMPNLYWPYHDKNGVIVSYDCRFNHADGTKDVLPLTYCVDDKGNGQWRWQGMDKPRTLSNLHLLLAQPNRPIIIVEGKKTAEAAERLLPNPIITTWQGGGNAVRFTDWSVLAGRKVTIWQDNDWPGYKATLEIADLIRDHVELLRFVHNPKEAEKGWDAADALSEGWTPEAARKYIIENAFDTPDIKQEPPKDEKTKKTKSSPVHSAQEKPADVSQGQQDHVATVFERVHILQENDTTQLPPEETAITQGSTSLQIEKHSSGRNGREVEDNFVSHIQSPDFRFLGFTSNDGKLVHCFYSNKTKTIIKMSGGAMAKGAALIELSPLDFWEQYFFKKNEGFNQTAAVNWLITTSIRYGMFSPGKIRGRGAWTDGKDIVVHAGDHLIINSVRKELWEYRGKYIYEQGDPLNLNSENPLTTKEARRFLDLSNMLRWERGINGYLLAGWCVIAPVCGALKWRPHIWITGGSGAGKTWVMGHIVNPMLGSSSLRVQGSTSEAGLRQALKRDALPVQFDEAEGENKSDQERMQSVLTLMRSASSEDGGNIIKGTSSSGADSYQIRSCFGFASIALQLSQQSDRTRITILELVAQGSSDAEKKERQDHFDKLLFTHYNLITPEYCQRLQARTIKLLPTILKNAHTFAAAAASTLGQQRAGDQLGALLAGAYSLYTEKIISYEEAIEWLRDKDFAEEHALIETKDEHSLWLSIMDTPLRVEGAFSTYERTVGELLRIVTGQDKEDSHVAVGSSEMSLKRFGVILSGDKENIIISNSTKGIKKSLENTPWAKNHHNLLIRIPGAQKIPSQRFGSGVLTRAVAIPIKYFNN